MTDSEPASQAIEPQTIWDALDLWAEKLAPWQRIILRAAICEGRVDDKTVDAAYRLFLTEKKLADAEPETPQTTPGSSRPKAAAAQALALMRVDGLTSVNALPAEAALTFGPQLTVIYGQNGAGKSGFVRVLANACFSRQKAPILPDINAEGALPATSASIHISLDGEPQRPLIYSVETDHSLLKRITVFDTAVARYLLSQASAFEFKPAGFDVFPEMVRVYGLLAAKLEADIAARTSENKFPAAFIGGGNPTTVHALVSTLGPATDLEAARKLAVYGDAERARLDQINAQLIALAAKSPKDALAALIEAKSDILLLATQLGVLGRLLGSDPISARIKDIGIAEAAKASATKLGSDQFQRDFFVQVGGEEWERFVASAHDLGALQGEHYPKAGERCLLCEQALSEDAAKHIQSLLEFSKGEARTAAAKAQAKLASHAKAVRELALEVFTDAARVKSHLTRIDPALAGQVDVLMTAARAAKSATLTDLENLTTTAKPIDTGAVLEALTALVGVMDGDIARLQADDTEASLSSLREEYRLLRHRNVLAQQLPEIEVFVRSATWAQKAAGARTAFGTRAITEKEKELFGQVIGERYRTRFAEECAALKCSVPVQLQTVGRSGQTLRSMEMKGGHKPDAVLSEGEQRAVALADFLTEVAMNPGSAGIVFDDPVNSLDHQRKALIARRLTSEANGRQVIVFTHDLVFLTALLTASEGHNPPVAVESHWIERTADGRPGQIALGDAPPTMKRYETTQQAKALLIEAKAASGSAREALVKSGMGAVRTTLEETIVKRLLKGVIPRWEDRVIVTGLRKVNWDDGKVEELCVMFEELSAYVEGHSHTDDATGAPPDVQLLEHYIERADELIKWFKADRPKKAA
jgi:energy-coupling factor transporter ATP-binding protein EcfA2